MKSAWAAAAVMSDVTGDESGLEVADVWPDGVVMYQLSSEQDVPGQPGRRGASTEPSGWIQEGLWLLGVT